MFGCTCFGRRGLLAGAAATLACRAALAQTTTATTAAPPRSAGPADPALVADLVVANHILADQGVVDGFGHVSVRHDKDPERFLLSRSMAPALVQAEDIMEFDLDGTPADNARGRSPYLERFIHAAIFRARPDVVSVVHNHSPGLIPFGAAGGAPLRPIYHMSAFLGGRGGGGGGVPVFEIRDAGGPATDMLVRNNQLARALAATLGPHPVALMRGHGCVIVGGGLKQSVFRAVYTEVNARLQSEAQRLGAVTFLNDEEAAAAAATNDGQVERPWALWKQRVAGR